MSDAVGLVVGTEDSTPLKFHVAVAPDAYLQLDDVVVTRRTIPGVGPVMTSGIVTEVRSRHEGASFGSDVFLIADGVLPAQVQEIAEITTTRVDPEVYVPPRPGATAQRAQGEERARALYFDQMEKKVPVGLGRDGAPVYLNLEFLNGVRGAHVSISGISGVATKTSFALWLLHSIFRSGVLGGGGRNSKALVFSVKGEDLLFLDKTNLRLDDKLREDYAMLDLPAAAFESVGFYSPPTPQDPTGRPHVTGRTSGVSAFWWTLWEFCNGGLLPYVFADVEDERNQYTMVVHNVASKLKYEAAEAGVDGAVTLEGRTIRTYEDLVDFVVEQLSDDSTRGAWAGPAIGQGTANAFIRRLISSVRPLRELIRGDLAKSDTRRVSTENAQITVVDLHNLQERGQRFVVGVVLAAETARKEAAGTGSLLFTMIDELNKYAPREGNSPIKDTLLDIAERGRSLGIILIGAQQTASEVERRIISNSSIKVVGRLDPAEAGRPEYGFLPPSQRQRATLAKPGTMFVTQPEIPVPLAVEFPFPAWATRLSEVIPGDLSAPDPAVASGRGLASIKTTTADVFSKLPPVFADDEPDF
ncbi:ATP-binding protein [Kineosporia succinea]|uniref:DNA helicase HerA-like ATPase n=1 Tax=Kineosporia succinea TaxID=84632 RepID=A0ABT9P5C6_9ACTN|nr:ATP-binding protein [Kineosporia succinea]MDP9827887.1 DNA helicase HerA-like ATPase [Kineosporia succinea]